MQRLAIAGFVAFASCLPARAATNLMLNPGFEEGQGNYAGVGKYWETNDGQHHPDIDALDNSTKHSGNWSQKLRASDSWDLGMVRQVSNYNTITAGKTYRVSAWVKTANVTNPAGWYVFGIWWMNAAGGVVGEAKMPQQGMLNYDWREIAYDAVAPAGATRVAALLTRHTNGDAWYDDVFIAEANTAPPVIALAPTSFTREVIQGQNLPNDSFTVQNSGGQTLNYTISESAAWLGVSPPSGSSTGEADAIAVQYNTSALALGPYTTQISVSAAGVANSPQNVTVSITVIPKPIPGDFDGNRDVDQADFGLFQGCYTGPGIAQNDPACAKARLDTDPDVDITDFGLFQLCMTGPNVTGNPNCIP